ncbi:hypothetical protein WR25_23664, partial [Diploscapter pachys]
MTSPFDADDLFRRSFLSSLISFRKKKRDPPTSRAEDTSSLASESSSSRPSIVPPVVVTSEVPTATAISNERTQFDIYREIVRDAERLESNVVTPLLSPSVSPSPYSEMGDNLAPPTSNLGQIYQNLQGINPDFPLSELLAPPPYSPALSSMFYPSMSVVDYQNRNRQNEAPSPMIPIKPELLKNPMAIEDIVRLVVEALQKSNIGNVSVSPSTPTPSSQSPPADENPQVILQRKRKQNNEAAARYRKRQKEAKEKAESELRDLEQQNAKLRQAATEIETQISLLKQRMLME